MTFIYPDKFVETKEEYQKRRRQRRRWLHDQRWYIQNSKKNGQYHSNYKYDDTYSILAKNLLDKDGIIFCFIDDNEVHNL